LHACHSEERSDEESAVLVWFLQEAEVSLCPCYSEERSDEESAVFLFDSARSGFLASLEMTNNKGSLKD